MGGRIGAPDADATFRKFALGGKCGRTLAGRWSEICRDDWDGCSRGRLLPADGAAHQSNRGNAVVDLISCIAKEELTS
jgi:hypothetical protein